MSVDQKTRPKPKPLSSRVRKMRHVPRYVVAKGGKLYWQPNRPLVAEGWQTARLPDDRREAYRVADEFNARLDAWRLNKGATSVTDVKIADGTLAWAIRAFYASREWQKLRERTQKDYRSHLKAIEAWAGKSKLGMIDREVVYSYQTSVEITLGERQAVYRMQVLRLLFAWAERTGKIASNPAIKTRISMPKARDAVWTDDQIQAFAKAARFRPDESDRKGLVLAMMLAVWTGQRQGDVLRMRWSDIQDGRLRIKQSKTGAEVDIPLGGAMRAALDAAERRGETVLTGQAGQPWNEHRFRQLWIRTQQRAGLQGVTFLDLRRTAVCKLAEAGCTTPEIAAITGHSQATVLHIIQTYLKPTRKLADAAMKKLEG